MEPYRRHQISLLILFVSFGLCDRLSPKVFAQAPGLKSPQTIDVWIGTGNTRLSQGIYHCLLNLESGQLSEPTLAVKVDGPEFLAMHPTLPVLYAACSIEQQPVVAAFAVSADNGKPSLSRLNSVATGDGSACHVSIDKTGSTLLSAQYGGGSVAVYALRPDGSILGQTQRIDHGAGSRVHPGRQDAAHPHWTGVSPDNRFALIPDLGMDQVVVYRIDVDDARIEPHGAVVLPPGSGPRHLKFHTGGRYLFVLNELTLTISTFRYEPENAATELVETVRTLPESTKQKEQFNSASEIRVHPNGRSIYAANRGNDTISVFTFDESTGKLTSVESEPIRGATPRNFHLEPSGRWLLAAGQDSHTLASFSIDPATGELTYNRSIVFVPSAICVLFGSPVKGSSG